MRLLFISNLFPDTAQPWRGLDNVTLLHAMRALRPDADIRVLCLRPSHAFWFGKDCPLQPRFGDEVFHPRYHWTPYVPKFGGANDRLFAMALRHALKSLPDGWKPDGLLVPWLFPDACGVNLVPELAGVPLVCVAQGSDVHHYLNFPMRRRAILNLVKRARIITRSEDLRQRLLKAGSEEDRVSTVYNGVDLETFHPGDKIAARAELKLPIDGKVLLFVGNFLPVKGLDLLIRSVAQISTTIAEPLHLVMIGSGPLQSELANLARQSGLKDSQIYWAGRRAPAEVAQFMRAADAVCLTSHNEGVPNVLLEALASGRPLVSTDVGGISEIINPSPQGGVLVKGRETAAYATALRQVIQSPPNTNLLSNYSNSFAWRRCAQTYWDFFLTKT